MLHQEKRRLAGGQRDSGNPADLRDNGSVIAGQNRGDQRQAAWFLGLRADRGQEADQAWGISGHHRDGRSLGCSDRPKRAPLPQDHQER